MIKPNFEDYYKRYYSRIFYFFYYQGLDKEDAKDLVHDTFLRVYRGWDDFRGETSFVKWIDIATKSVWCNYLRAKKTKKREAMLVSLEDVSGKREPTDDVHPEKSAIDQNHQELLREAIHRLPERTRAVVILRVYHGLRFSEIAALLGVSEETAKSQNSHGKKKLEELLADHFDPIGV